MSLRRRSEVAQQDAAESVIHFAEHAAHVFDFDARAVVMFTSGTTGRAKAVSLTWGNICFASEASNRTLNRRGEGMWQAVLPLYHIGGFQVVVRSVLNGSPFVLYRRFDAVRLLSDAAKKGATHVSVVDKMLQDMVAADKPETLARYSCILLGGGALNPADARSRVPCGRARVRKLRHDRDVQPNRPRPGDGFVHRRLAPRPATRRISWIPATTGSAAWP